MISFIITLQRFRLSKIVICVYFYLPIKKQMFHNVSFLNSSIFSLKKVFAESVFGTMKIKKNISKFESFDLGSYFCL